MAEVLKLKFQEYSPVATWLITPIAKQLPLLALAAKQP
jgi:hypothetical protein